MVIPWNPLKFFKINRNSIKSMELCMKSMKSIEVPWNPTASQSASLPATRQANPTAYLLTCYLLLATCYLLLLTCLPAYLLTTCFLLRVSCFLAFSLSCFLALLLSCFLAFLLSCLLTCLLTCLLAYWWHKGSQHAWH